jgi:hypothetical protein
VSTFKGFGVPPTGNTGVPVVQVEVHIDWLQGSFPFNSLPAVRALIERETGFPFSDETTGCRWYKTCYTNYVGAYLATEPRVSHSDRCSLTLPAQTLSGLSVYSQKLIINELAVLGFTCTRIDPCIDDFTKTLTPDLIRQTVEAGNQKGFSSNPYTDWRSSGEVSAEKSCTYYVGRRGKSGSGKVIRCYTKYLESRGEVDSVRFEIEMSQEYSSNLFSCLAMTHTSLWSSVLLASITGAVDFIDRSFSSRLSECPRLDWWEKVVGDDASIKVSKPRKLKSITKSINWINKQVSPTLSVVFDYFVELGYDFEVYCWELYFRGVSRQTDFQKQMLYQSLSA